MAVVGLQGVTENTRKKMEQYQAGYNASAAVQAAQQAMQQAQSGKPADYTPGSSVLAAQNRMNQLQGQKPADYTPSASVVQAQNTMNQLQANKPGQYQSRYAGQLDSILAQIQNPEGFQYDFNGDELFKSYADLYTQQGKQASLDAMGQAAGLTGGYGNSYSQGVGQQAYQQYLLGLYDKGMDLRDRAYQEYADKLQNRKDTYSLMKQAEDTDYDRYLNTVNDWRNDLSYYTNLYGTERDFDYGQHRDTVNDWRSDLSYATDMYNNERTFDYNKYRDVVSDWTNNRDYYTDRYDVERKYDESMYELMLNYWTGLAEIENADYNSQLEREEAIREYNEKMELEKAKLEEDKRRYDQEWAAQQAAAEEAALASSGGSGNSGSTGHYEQIGGKIYSVNDKGNYKEEDASKTKGTFSDDYDTFWNKAKILANTANNTDLLKLQKKK